MKFLYSGSFNPTTQAHCIIINYFYYRHGKVIVNFTGDDYPKPELRRVKEREAVFNSIIKKTVACETTTVYNPTNSKSISTLELVRLYKKDYKEEKAHLIVGEDVFLDIVNWGNDINELSEECVFWVVKRNKETKIDDLIKYANKNNLRVSKYLDIRKMAKECNKERLICFSNLNPLLSGTELRKLTKDVLSKSASNNFQLPSDYYLSLIKYYGDSKECVDIKNAPIINNNILIYKSECYSLEWWWDCISKGLTVLPKNLLATRKYNPADIKYENSELAILKFQRGFAGERLYVVNKKKKLFLVIEKQEANCSNFKFKNFNEKEKTFVIESSSKQEILFNYDEFCFLNPQGIKVFFTQDSNRKFNEPNEILCGTKLYCSESRFKLINNLKEKITIEGIEFYLTKDKQGYLYTYDERQKYITANYFAKEYDKKIDVDLLLKEENTYCKLLEQFRYQDCNTGREVITELLYSEEKLSLYYYNRTDSELVGEYILDAPLKKTRTAIVKNKFYSLYMITIDDSIYLVDYQEKRFERLSAYNKQIIEKIEDVIYESITETKKEIILNIKKIILKNNLEEN